MLITANGLVTRSYSTGEKDRIVHILTEEYGRVAVMVKGGRTAAKNGANAITQPYIYGNYELYRGNTGDLYWLRGGSTIHHFFGVTHELSHLALAAYLCDLATEITEEGTATPESSAILRMLLNTLHILADGDKPTPLVKGVFEFRTAALMGYGPNLTGCVHCGEVYPDEGYFDVMNGCIVCADCQRKRDTLRGRVQQMKEEELGERRIICPLSASVLAALRYTLTAPDKKIFSFALTDPEELRHFATLTETYLLNHLEHDFDTLKFYRSVMG